MNNVIQRVFEVLKENEKRLNKITSEEKTYKGFTDELKFLIGKLGEEEFGCEVSTQCSKHKFTEGEWLFDMVWFKMNEDIKEFNCVKSIDLVLESEISGKRLQDFKVDFDKLLFVKNATKIMVFTKVKNERLMREIIAYAETSVNNFDGFDKGDMIHLILFDEYYEGDLELKTIKKI